MVVPRSATVVVAGGSGGAGVAGAVATRATSRGPVARATSPVVAGRVGPCTSALVSAGRVDWSAFERWSASTGVASDGASAVRAAGAEVRDSDAGAETAPAGAGPAAALTAAGA